MSRGAGKFLKMKLSGGRNKREGEGPKFGPIVQQPAQVRNTPIYIPESKYFSESSHT